VVDSNSDNLCFFSATKWSISTKFFLLRGNHETSSTNAVYGFNDEIDRRYPSRRQELWKAFNETFAFIHAALSYNWRPSSVHAWRIVTIFAHKTSTEARFSVHFEFLSHVFFRTSHFYRNQNAKDNAKQVSAYRPPERDMSKDSPEWVVCKN
jgi:hypothetical protein